MAPGAPGRRADPGRSTGELTPIWSAPLSGSFCDAVRAGVQRHHPGAGMVPMLVPGGTDGRYWRQRGYAAYGFAPVVIERADLGRVHGIDERISVRTC